MAGSAVIAASLTAGATAPAYALWIDGLNVLTEPGGKRWWVTVESVRPTIAGPGGVSTLEFTITDPSQLITVTDGQRVVLHRLSNDKRLFQGWISRYSLRPRRGGVGRMIDVTCVGVDSLLDWAVITTAVTFGTVLAVGTMVQQLVAVSTAAGLDGVRALGDPTNAQGSQAFPIANQLIGTTSYSNQDEAGNVIPVAITVGTTLREAINQVCRSAGLYGTFVFTIDHTMGLRLWVNGASGNFFSPTPSTADNLAITATVASTAAPGALAYDVDAASIVRRVLVLGTGVSATVDDGTGKAGPMRVLNDPTITTAAGCRAAGYGYLADNRAGLRGTVTLEDSAAYANLGSEEALWGVNITDASIGLSGARYMTGSMAFRFYGSKTDYDLAFGGLEPSGARLMRQLTRGTLS